MSTWLDRLRGADSHGAERSGVATYKALRAAGQSWFPKMMEHPAAKPFNIVKAAKKLTLPVVDNMLVFDDEADSAVLMDFYLFDYRLDGKSVAESCNFAPGELAPLESDHHHACLASRTSLFEITHVHNQEPKILLRDRLEKDRPELWLTDIGLSDSFRRLGGRAFMFTRVLSLHGHHTTGGFSFVFDPRHEFALVDGYRREMWSASASQQPARRTIFFFRLNRKFGLAREYKDVVPAEPDDAV